MTEPWCSLTFTGTIYFVFWCFVMMPSWITICFGNFIFLNNIIVLLLLLLLLLVLLLLLLHQSSSRFCNLQQTTASGWSNGFVWYSWRFMIKNGTNTYRHEPLPKKTLYNLFESCAYEGVHWNEMDGDRDETLHDAGDTDSHRSFSLVCKKCTHVKRSDWSFIQ